MQAMKIISKRPMKKDAIKDSEFLQKTFNLLRKNALVPKGVYHFKTEKEAISLANDTLYGLGAQIYSNNKARARRVASKIDAGTIDINSANHWLACNPFGGFKYSGMGREHGEYGFRELTQVKVIAEEK